MPNYKQVNLALASALLNPATERETLNKLTVISSSRSNPSKIPPTKHSGNLKDVKGQLATAQSQQSNNYKDVVQQLNDMTNERKSTAQELTSMTHELNKEAEH